MSSPPTRSTPPSGRSMPAIRLSSVLLPEPDGPINAMKSPSSMESVMLDSTGTVCTPRRYDFTSCDISTSGAAPFARFIACCPLMLWLRHVDFRAVRQLRVGRTHQHVAGAHAVECDQVAEFRARRDRHLMHGLVLDDEDDAASVALNDGGGLRGDDGPPVLRRHRFGQESGLCAHVRQHAWNAIDEAHLDEHRRLRAV